LDIMNQTKLQGFTDYTSLSLAGICAIHCFLTPVALILFPVVGSTFFSEEIFHELMLLLVVPASVIAIFLGCRRHKDFSVITLGILGLSFLLAGAFAATGYEDSILTLIGAFIMVLGHLRNFRLCRKDGCEH
jgi:hypothetical protein